MNLSTKTPNWDTHSQTGDTELEWPLFSVGNMEPFVARRKYAGPRVTFALAPLDALDAEFNGVARSISGVAATDIITFVAANEFFTGCPLTLAISGGLTGLSAQKYYYIRLTETTGKLATSITNAYAGTAVDFSADGTGTLTPPIAYLVDHSGLADADGGQCSYERVFATVPTSWNEPEGYDYTFPSFPATTFGTAYAITAIAASGNNLVLSSSTWSGIVANDVVYLNLKYTRDGYSLTQAFQAKVVSVSAGVSVTVAYKLPGTGAFSAVTGSTLAELTPGRLTPKDISGTARVFREYALTSEAAVATDLPVLQAFKPVDADGNETDALTASTSPTAAAYQAMITSGGEIQPQASRTLRYMGNIYLRETRYLVAQ